MRGAGVVTAADFLERFLAGDRLALARAISAVEDEADGYRDFLRRIYGRAGRAYLIGVTGPPGAGKSTLVSHLAGRYAAAGQTVGVVAVDPTSPFTGGALLGDRIRMHDLAGNERVFIRSMATRGSLGGLAKATGEVALTMDAFGFDVVLIETVGVGQSELDVANSADTTAVVVVPESGDAVQAMK
ncbi:MAG TPA: methylmalonyl Co-A mutase-associated GTPase MeaB, partial [bacterium]|nr:methylmalonyl Co-A mutase-associated GTPase MeaB [bacterium]